MTTDFPAYKADVANVIPPQKAGQIAELAGVADRTGWCPIDPVTFESTLQPNIHVIGDAAIAGAMPKSAFAANAQAKVCAAAVAALLAGGTPAPPKLINTCYQPGGAGLRDLGCRRVSAGRTASSSRSRAPAASARSMRRRRCGRRRQGSPMAGSARSPPKSSAEWSARVARRVAALLLASARRSGTIRRRLRALRGRRRCHPEPADRRAGRSDARPRDRRQPPAGLVPAMPQRTLPGGAAAGHAGAEPRRRRLALVGRAAAAAHRRCEPRSTRTRSCRPITARRT